ncbi:MAG: HDOD domain-containing protein [Bdellovibrionales bacterium]|nr:HDOD domain-containing protein [Bdellovibrionales bacterium]
MSSAEHTAPPEEYKDHVAPGKDWTEIVAWVSDLPPLPHVASQAIALIEDPDTTAQQLTNLLGQDTALAARVLKIANSAMFSCQREITTLNQAIMIIGFKSLKGIIVAATLRQLNRKFGKLERTIWENSTGTAIIASQLSQKLKKPFAEEAFLLGLLHDLGKLVLVRQVSDEYTTIAKITKTGRTFADVEQEKFGFAHPLIGALVAKKWNFSPDACQVILHHHDPLDPPFESDLEEKTAIIQAADLVCHLNGMGHFDGYPDLTDETHTLLKQIGIAEEEILPFIAEAKASVEEKGAAFS